METLALLQEWYLSQCDGDWEHTWGIKIGTLDNPGWTVSIDLRETELESTGFDASKTDRGPDDWLHCNVVDASFEGRGGPLNLEEILLAFLRWVQENRTD